MSKIDYLTEDTINPPDQQFICVSFFSKNYIKQAIDNNNEYRKEEEKESYSTEENVFALKFRGAFSTFEEACKHAEKLRSVDQYHNVYVMENGKWGAFKIDDDDKYVKQTEHANDQLNDMMKKYMENQEKAKLYHEFRKNQMVQKSLEENLENRRQNMNETEELLKEVTDKSERNKLKEKRETIEEQIRKLEERKLDLDSQSKTLEDKLKLGQLNIE
jgi:chromosome condensin MukBEF ATPase and DNA-binding subunit MukB